MNKIIPISDRALDKIELIKEQGFELYLKNIKEMKNSTWEFFNEKIYKFLKEIRINPK